MKKDKNNARIDIVLPQKKKEQYEEALDVLEIKTVSIDLREHIDDRIEEAEIKLKTK